MVLPFVLWANMTGKTLFIGQFQVTEVIVSWEGATFPYGFRAFKQGVKSVGRGERI